MPDTRVDQSGPPEDPFDLGGVTIADKYRVGAVVGHGGFGVVYRGVHTGFGEPIAIKCLRLGAELDEAQRDKLLSRLQDEGRVLHRLSKLSSGIVQALDVGALSAPSGQWVPYLVMEWLDGETLAEHLAERRRSGAGPMPLVEAMELLGPAARALAVAHEQKIAHRDVKPENIYLADVQGRRAVKILDFGIAKVLSQHATFTAAAAATQKGASVFTPSYGAPEQFNKKRGATGPWTDVFALALILVELSSGSRALDGDDATQLYIASADPASRPTLRAHGVDAGDAVEEVLQRALAVDPSDRYQNAGVFWSALEDAVAGRPAASRPPPDISETGEFVSRHDIELDLSAGPPRAEPARGSTTVSDRPPPAPTKNSATVGGAVRSDPSSPESGSRWVPLVVMLALGGAGALYWQMQSIGPTPIEGETNATPPLPPTEPAPVQSALAPAPTLHSPRITPAPPAADAGDQGEVADAGPDAANPDAANPDAAPADGGPGDAGAEDASSPATAPAGMVYVPLPGDAGTGGFFIDKTEVTTGAYRACVMAGRCKKATRIVLTVEAAAALGGAPDVGDTSPEKLAQAWQPRCNEVRGATDHPVNCVSHGSAADYCQWQGKRLPSSSEWTIAAGNQQYPWGDDAPECGFACYGRNGTCVTSAKQVASCAAGSHPKDVTPSGLSDIAGNLAEWVADKSTKTDPGGPAWRVLRGGSFTDEAAALPVTTSRAVPPVTAYVTIGFRCAKDAPAGTGG